MVSRRLKIFLFILCGLFLVLAPSAWLVGTRAGTVWLLEHLSRWTATPIEFAQIEGSLLGQLEVDGLTISWPQGRIHADRLDWNLGTLPLLVGELHWSEIGLRGIKLELADSADEPVIPERRAFRFPAPDALPAWLGMIDLSVSSLKVDQFSLIRAGRENLEIERLAGDFYWLDSSLNLNLAELVTSDLQVAAKLSFQADTLAGRGWSRVDLHQPRNGVDAAEANWTFSAAAGKSLKVAGDLVLRSNKAELAQATGRLLVSGGRLEVEKVVVDRSGREDHLELSGILDWSDLRPTWSAAVKASHCNLAEWGIPVRLDGKFSARGSGETYRGDFSLDEPVPGWPLHRIAGNLSGDFGQMTVSDIDGSLLDGTLAGRVDIDWSGQVDIGLDLRLRQINLQSFVPQLQTGLDLDVVANWSATDPAGEYSLKVSLLPSQWLDNRLSGTLVASGTGDKIVVSGLDISGDGLQLKGSGRLADKFDFEIHAPRLAGWWPGIAGGADAAGWLRWVKSAYALQVEGHLAQASVAEYRLDSLQFSGETRNGLQQFELLLDGKGGGFKQTAVDSFHLDLQGSDRQHRAQFAVGWSDGKIDGAARGAWQNGTWDGEVEQLALTEKLAGSLVLAHPVSLSASQRQLRVVAMQLLSDQGETLELNVDLALAPLRGQGRLSWQGLNLARLNHWLPVTFAGSSSGEAEMALGVNRPESFRIAMTAGMSVNHETFRVDDARLRVEGDWGGAGLHLLQTLELAEGGKFELRAKSAALPRWNLPLSGEAVVEWEGLPLLLLRSWLPPEINLQGFWEGVADCSWDEGGNVDLGWDSQLEQGELRWRQQSGEFAVSGLEGYFDGEWKNNLLTSDTAINLANHGRFKADIRLPLSSRSPFQIDRQKSWQGHIDFDARESGILSYALPGMVEQTRGKVAMHVGIAGTPALPTFNGSMQLSEASGTLPSLGIHLDDIALKARLENEQVIVDDLLLASGKGRLHGSGEFSLKGWRLARQSWRLQGENMPVVNLPELELILTPDLAGKGEGEALEITGTLKVPRMKLRSVRVPGKVPVSSSSDVVVVDSNGAAETESPYRLTAAIRLELGKQILIDTAGVDARLTGALDLKVAGLDRITASGQIDVAEGMYVGHGVRLPIDRGRLLFAGGPLDRPVLDILALRKIEEVKAGVKVSGTPQRPVVELYSEPTMSDTDVLAYIVFGRPFSKEGSETDVLLLAAGALLSQGESVALQDTLQRRLGIDVFDVNTGQGDVTESVVTIGKYLQPDLYVSLGYSVFTQTNEVRLRYNLSEKWELQSNMGITSGADIYYRIEFK